MTPRLPPVRTVGAWRVAAKNLLRTEGIDAPAFTADLLMRHVLGGEALLNPVELTLARDRLLMPVEKRRLSRLLHRRLAREPIQYVLGTAEFMGLTFRVNRHVLIPRPETEGLVERVLRFLGPDPEGCVVDVGTGSGAIACALAQAAPRLQVWASDCSAPALAVARENIRHLGLAARVHGIEADLLQGVPPSEPPPPLRVVVSNPPYVADAHAARLAPEVVAHEPHLALFAGRDGLEVIRRLVDQAWNRLEPGGLLAVEIGEDQGEALQNLLAASGMWAQCRVEQDLAGRPRYALAVRRGPKHNQGAAG